MINRHLSHAVLAIMTIALPIHLGYGAEEEVGSESRVEVGTRILHINLLDDKQGESHGEGTFIGSIGELDADQDYTPLNPYVQVLFPFENVSAGGGVSYSQLFVDTVDDGGGDGQVESESLQLYAIVSFDSFESVTPYVEVGVAFYQSDFAPTAEWSEGGRRAFEFDDSTAPYIAGGCTIDVAEQWAIDIYARYIDVDVDGKFIFDGDEGSAEPFTFTFEHLALGVGAKYTF